MVKSCCLEISYRGVFGAWQVALAVLLNRAVERCQQRGFRCGLRGGLVGWGRSPFTRRSGVPTQVVALSGVSVLWWGASYGRGVRGCQRNRVGIGNRGSLGCVRHSAYRKSRNNRGTLHSSGANRMRSLRSCGVSKGYVDCAGGEVCAVCEDRASSRDRTGGGGRAGCGKRAGGGERAGCGSCGCHRGEGRGQTRREVRCLHDGWLEGKGAGMCWMWA